MVNGMNLSCPIPKCGTMKQKTRLKKSDFFQKSDFFVQK